jgi:hypothetical protein
MGKFIRFLFAVLLAPLFVAFVYEALVLLIENVEFSAVSFVAYGFLLYVVSYFVISRQAITFLEVLEHEFGHAVAALFAFRQVKELKVTPVGGETTYESRGAHIGVTLAPYCLPIILLPLLALCLVIPPPVKYAIDFLIGVALAFHLVALFRLELRASQPDLRQVGCLFSLGVIGTMNAALLVVVYGVVSAQYASILEYLSRAYQRMLILYQAILEWLSALIAG